MQIGDVIQTFEARYADGSDWNYQNYRQSTWVANYPASRFAHTVLACSSKLQVDNVVAQAKQRGIGYIYAFDGNNVPGDGYSRLPATPLWVSQLAAVGR